MSIDIEDLNKSQIILLTLLVSFVTSIATGIVTVSLMEEAPKDVVRVVQRVVERTVEKVPEKIKTPEPTKEKVIVQEKTIVVKESDILSQSIERNKNKILKVVDGSDKLLTFAYPIAKNKFLGDAANIKADTIYKAIDISGNVYKLKASALNSARGLVFFDLKEGDYKYSPIGLDENIVLGKSGFFFNSYTLDLVRKIIVSNVKPGLFAVDANTEFVLPGTAIFSVDGKLLGISTFVSRQEGNLYFVKSLSIKASELVQDSSQENSESNDSQSEAVDNGQSTSSESNNSSSGNAGNSGSENQGAQAENPNVSGQNSNQSASASDALDNAGALSGTEAN